MSRGHVALAHLCGAQSVELKVASYQDSTWQAIVKHRDATLSWAVVIDTDPDKALMSACAKFCGMYPNRPAHRVRTRRRTRPRQAG